MNDPLMTIKIIGHQWYWTYEYPDLFHKACFKFESNDYSRFIFDSYMIKEEDLVVGHFRLLAVDNLLILPTKVTIRLLLTSGDVIHS